MLHRQHRRHPLPSSNHGDGQTNGSNFLPSDRRKSMLHHQHLPSSNHGGGQTNGITFITFVCPSGRRDKIYEICCSTQLRGAWLLVDILGLTARNDKWQATTLSLLNFIYILFATLIRSSPILVISIGMRQIREWQTLFICKVWFTLVQERRHAL